MFNFSANHLFLLSRTEYSSCVLLLMFDRDTGRVYRLFDFTKRLRPIPGCAYWVAGKVNSVNTLIWLLSRSSWTANTGGLLLLLFRMTAREVSLFHNSSLAAKNLKQRLLANLCSSPPMRVLGQQSCRHWLNLFRRFRLPFIPPLTGGRSTCGTGGY